MLSEPRPRAAHRRPGRRRFLCSALALAALPVSHRVPAASGVEPLGRFVFDIELNDSSIGRQVLQARRDDDRLILLHERTLRVKLLGLEVYSAQHHSEEHWRDGRLLSLRSSGVESGSAYQVEGEARDEGFELRYRVDGETPGQLRLPADIGTTDAFWTTSHLQRRALVDSEDGEHITASFSTLGEELLDGRSTRRCALAAGNTEADVWFADGVMWRALFRHDGHEVGYRREMPAHG